MSKKSYSDKLKDPRWQKKRLEALEEAGFACENCGDTTTELHVHHKIYRKGYQPWDYKTYDLAILCKNCHDKLHIAKERFTEVIGGVLEDTIIEQIAGYVLAIKGDVWPEQLDTPERITGYADLYRTSTSAVEYLISYAEKKENGEPLSPGAALARQVG